MKNSDKQPSDLKITKMSNFKKYCLYRDSQSAEFNARNEQETEIINQSVTKKQSFVKGYSWPAQSNSKFSIGTTNGDFRETLVCEKTSLNNRTRATVHVFEFYFKPKNTQAIYLTEQCTALGKWMQNKYPNISCSEYLKGVKWRRKRAMKKYISPFKLKHQDITRLSFNKAQFDYVLSFDCFEHISEYIKAFKECYRVLKNNGKLIFTVPFDRNSQDSLIRASVKKDGSIIHHCEPEYHGNPMSDEGCLSYYTFGWELLNELKKVGFSDTYVLLTHSIKYCYFGNEQLMLCAHK